MPPSHVAVADGYRLEGRITNGIVQIGVFDIAAEERHARNGERPTRQRELACELALELDDTQFADVMCWLAALGRRLTRERHDHEGAAKAARTHLQMVRHHGHDRPPVA